MALFVRRNPEVFNVTEWDAETIARVREHKGEITDLNLNGLTKIPPRAFADCVKLVQVNLGATLTEIGQDAFANCPLLTEDGVIAHNREGIHIKAKDHPLRRICDNAFQEGMNNKEYPSFLLPWRNLAQTENPGLNIEIIWRCKKEIVRHPEVQWTVIEQFDPATVKRINLRGSEIKYLDLTRVDRIPEKAFVGCTSVLHVNFGNNLQSIGNFALCKSTKLEPKNVHFLNEHGKRTGADTHPLQSIGASAFPDELRLCGIPSDCFLGDWLTIAQAENEELDINDLWIRGERIRRQRPLVSVLCKAPGGSLRKYTRIVPVLCSSGEYNIAESVRCCKIDPGTVHDLSDFMNVFTPKRCIVGINELSNLYSVDLRKVTHISDGAFSGCKKLSEVYIDGTVKYIGDNAFSGCTALRRVILWQTDFACLAYVGEGAFRDVSLKSLQCFMPWIEKLAPNTSQDIKGLWEKCEKIDLRAGDLLNRIESPAKEDEDDDPAAVAVTSVTSAEQGLDALLAAKKKDAIKEGRFVVVQSDSESEEFPIEEILAEAGSAKKSNKRRRTIAVFKLDDVCV